MKMKIVSVCGSRFGRIASIGGLMASLLVSAACGSAGDASGSGLGIDNMRQGLAAVDLQSVNGPTEPVARIERAAGASGFKTGATLDNAALTVVLDNDACVLTLTELNIGGAKDRRGSDLRPQQCLPVQPLGLRRTRSRSMPTRRSPRPTPLFGP